MSKAYLEKQVNEFNSIEEIDKEIATLLSRIAECVGTLYPPIMWGRIDKLNDRRVELAQLGKENGNS